MKKPTCCSQCVNKDGERYNIDKSIRMYQPHYDYGLVLKDFKRLDKLIEGMIE